MPPEAVIHVEVAGAAAGLSGPVGLALPIGARLSDALARLGVATDERSRLGIWGQRAVPETPLRDGDRIECYRPLEADPKAARRARARR